MSNLQQSVSAIKATFTLGT